jgi:hypothetical protein
MLIFDIFFIYMKNLSKIVTRVYFLGNPRYEGQKYYE